VHEHQPPTTIATAASSWRTRRTKTRRFFFVTVGFSRVKREERGEGPWGWGGVGGEGREKERCRYVVK